MALKYNSLPIVICVVHLQDGAFHFLPMSVNAFTDLP